MLFGIKLDFCLFILFYFILLARRVDWSSGSIFRPQSYSWFVYGRLGFVTLLICSFNFNYLFMSSFLGPDNENYWVTINCATPIKPICLYLFICLFLYLFIYLFIYIIVFKQFLIKLTTRLVSFKKIDIKVL